MYEIEEEINSGLLKKGRSGRNFYYGLKAKVDFKIKRPILEEKEYFRMKNNLINIINNHYLYREDNNGKYYAIYENLQSEYMDKFDEGNKKTIIINTRERNKEAVKKAKQIFKVKHNNELFCEVCGFDFKKVYGELGEDFIECHHINPISSMDEDDVTKIDDLVMLCSNCHRMVHRREKVLSIEELKRYMED